jgi:hypothetical protein
VSRWGGALGLVPSLWLAVPGAAFAGRPDDGGDLHDFDETDVLAAVDGPAGVVRVHYSVDGPNATLLRDDDGSGHPDYPEEVATVAEDVLAAYAAAAFRTPVSESDVGLEPLGGSDAFDFYLLDYGGSADGQFSVDACEGGVCAGHMLMENDFRGYGYPSLSEAIRVLTSHELFHAVQAAYVAELPVWVSEGTAVWAERFYDPGVQDFFWFASAYLEDTGRSIDRPPVGPVPAFAYGTCLFWEFLGERFGDGAIQSLLEHSAELEGLDAIEAMLAGEASTLRGEWIAFSAANLATGPRAGGESFYPFSAELDGLEATDAGESIHDDNRFYPLAATYYLLGHRGGTLWFAALDDPTGLLFSLHEVLGAGPDAELGETLAQWEPSSGAAVAIVPDLPRGDYWLRGTYPERAAQSRKVELCVGTEDAIAPCVPPEPDAGLDAGPDGGVDAGGALDAGLDAAQDAGGPSGGACSCEALVPERHGRSPLSTGALVPLCLAILGVSRRRR